MVVKGSERGQERDVYGYKREIQEFFVMMKLLSILTVVVDTKTYICDKIM